MVPTDRSRFIESRLVDKCSHDARMDGTLMGGTGRGGGGGGGEDGVVVIDAETVSFGRTWTSRSFGIKRLTECD